MHDDQQDIPTTAPMAWSAPRLERLDGSDTEAPKIPSFTEDSQFATFTSPTLTS